MEFTAHNTPSHLSISLCAEKHMSCTSAFKTAYPAKHWQHPYIPEVHEKAMTTAGVGTRRQLHHLAEGDEEVAATSKRKMNFGSSEAWL